MKKQFTLHQIELFIGNFLRYGVLLCAFVIAVGIALSLMFPSRVEPPMADFLSQVLQGKLVQVPLFGSLTNPNTIISVGLLMLIALPILRVALTFFVFLLEGDYAYMIITAIVFIVLLVGLIWGKEL